MDGADRHTSTGPVPVGIDAGQSTIRIQLGTEAEPRTTAGLAHPATDDQLVARIADTLADVTDVGRVVAGLTTLPATPAERRRLAAALQAALDATEVWVTGDDVTAHAGAFAGSSGVVVVVGTGVAALAADPAAGTARSFDGAGHLIGDEGGAFWLGRHGIRAALAAAEGRSRPTRLGELVTVRFGPLEGLPTRLHTAPDAIDRIAHAAIDVLAAASEGDAVADRLLDTAADRLCETAVAAAATLSGDVRIALDGRLLTEGSPLLARLTDRLEAALDPRAHVDLRAGAGLAGAAALADADPAGYLRWATNDRDATGARAPSADRASRSGAGAGSSAADRFLEIAVDVLERIAAGERASIARAANLLADTVAGDGLIHVFGTGHSHLLAEEVFYRAGGLTAIDPILVPSLMLHESATRSTDLERSVGLADDVLADVALAPGDSLIVASNSGGQTVTVELAERCRAAGVAVVAVVSRRHAATKPDARLLDVADVVIDNHGVVGDAALAIPGVEAPVGPTSTVAGAAIMQALVAATVEQLVARGMEPAVLRSANTPEGDAHNERLLAAVRARIRTL